MANYSLVVNSKFQPFSFERYIQPYQIYGQAYKEIEDQYGELATKANVWEEMANEQTDPYAYKMYKTYANDLEEKAGQLAREGLNATSRREMLNMRARYSKEITPIEQAYKSRAEEIKEQTAGRANGIVYEGNASTSSLDRYLKNPSTKYNSADSKEGSQRVATAATALQKKLREYGRGKPLDGFTRTWLQEHGYRDNEVYQAINDIQGALQGDGNIRGNNVLTSILADEMNTSGVNLWKDQNARLDYFNRIAPALYQAVGQTNIGAYEDKAATLAAQEAMQIRAETRAAAREGVGDTNNLNYKPRTLSHLDISGDVSSMKLAKSNLSIPNGKGLKASYFGRRGEINPMKVYEEYKRLMRPSGTELFQASRGVHISEQEKREKALKSIRQKYGNIKVISDSEYNALRLSGYNNKSSFKDFTNLNSNMDNAIKSYTEYFINGDPNYFAKVMNNNISFMKDKSFANAVTILDDKLNATSDKFNPEDYGTKDNPIVDFSHITKHRNKVIVTYKDGTKVAVTPELISGEMNTLFNLYEAERQNKIKHGYSSSEADDILEPYLMQGITNLGLRGFNQGIPSTNSKLEE